MEREPQQTEPTLKELAERVYPDFLVEDALQILPQTVADPIEYLRKKLEI